MVNHNTYSDQVVLVFFSYCTNTYRYMDRRCYKQHLASPMWLVHGVIKSHSISAPERLAGDLKNDTLTYSASDFWRHCGNVEICIVNGELFYAELPRFTRLTTLRGIAIWILAFRVRNKWWWSDGQISYYTSLAQRDLYLISQVKVQISVARHKSFQLKF